MLNPLVQDVTGLVGSLKESPGAVKVLTYGIAGLSVAATVGGSLMVLRAGLGGLGGSLAFLTPAVANLGAFAWKAAPDFMYASASLGDRMGLLTTRLGLAGAGMSGLLSNLASLGAAAGIGYAIGTGLNYGINMVTKALTDCDTLADWVFNKVHRKELAELQRDMSLQDVLTARAAQLHRPLTDREVAKVVAGLPQLAGDLSAADRLRLSPLLVEETTAFQRRKAVVDPVRPTQIALMPSQVPPYVPAPAPSSAPPDVAAMQARIATLEDQLQALTGRPVVVQIDGREVGRASTDYIARELRTKRNATSSRFDAGRDLPPAGRRRIGCACRRCLWR
ncbi:MAG: hypothetical protein JO002_03215, partial [Burkholderiaceae bacterium]|nr:hypothetical protein [Burkholderiaceae bacterium]